MTVDAAGIAKVYIRIRDKKAELKRDYEAQVAELDSQLNTLQSALLGMCESTGADSLKTPYGTVIRSVKTRYWPTDWDAFQTYVVENNAIRLLEHRVSQSAVQQWLEETNLTTLPGLQLDRSYSITVRRNPK